MAKYVGKIFRVPNKFLGLKGEKTHNVYVSWFNPFKRKFNVKIITSLEDKKSFNDYSYKKGDCAVFDEKDKSHFVLNRSKYVKLRQGKITPIPFNKCENFKVWSGFQGSTYLNKNQLTHKTNSKIKK